MQTVNAPFPRPLTESSSAKVLCVDDEAHVLKALTRTLERAGYDVLTASDGSAALAILEEHRPAVVISDYRMAGVDGALLLKEVKRIHPATQRVMVTGFADMAIVEKAINEGEVNRFLTKPWKNDELLEVLASAVERHELLAENERLQELTSRQNERLKELAEGLEAKVEERTRLLIRAKRAWEQTFDAIVDPLALIDRDYTVVRGNLAWAGTAGIDVRQITGKKCHEVLFGKSSPCESCPLQETVENDTMGHAEVHADDSDRIYRLWTFPMPAEQPGVSVDRVVCHYKDVTDEKAIARHLQQSEKMAAVGQLAGGVAHEINNPLSAIIAFTQLGLRDVEAGTEMEEFLRESEESAQRCKEIVQNLLTFSRIPQVGEVASVDVNHVVERALVLTAHELNRGFTTLDIACDEDVPGVRGSASQLMQVLVNLLTNAKGAMPDGGTIGIRTSRATDGRVVMSVSDTGTGIPEDILPRLFEPFFTTKEEGKGTGLGLSVSYGIIEEHGGAIEVETKLGLGSTFHVLLPAISPQETMELSGESTGAKA